MKRPPRTSNRNDASTNSPASELSTTSTPAPPVAARNFSSNSNVRESPIWSSSKPIARNVSHLPRLAVAKTSAPQCRPAAPPPCPPHRWRHAPTPADRPAPPPTPTTRTTPSKTPPARRRPAPTTIRPAPRSPTARPPPPQSPPPPTTPSPHHRRPSPRPRDPTSTTTPAPSTPSSPPPGYIPNATNTSRKFTPTAATATRTCPAASSTGGHDCTSRSSKVPPLPAVICHASAGNSSGAAAPSRRQPRGIGHTGAHHHLRLATIDYCSRHPSIRPNRPTPPAPDARPARSAPTPTPPHPPDP